MERLLRISLCFQIFPVRLSEAFIQYCLMGMVSEDCVFSSFLNLMSTKDRNILQSCLEDQTIDFNGEQVMDVLADYNITTLPTKENLRSITLNAALLTLLSKPLLFVTNLKEGMGRFWNTVTAEEIHSLYELHTSTSERVLFFTASYARQIAETEDG